MEKFESNVLPEQNTLQKSRRSGDTQDKSRRSGDTQDKSRRSGDTQDKSRRTGDTQDKNWWAGYHLVIAVMGSIILLISNGMTISGLTPFRVEFAKLYGFSMEKMTFGDLITFSVVGILAPLLGGMMDRIGVKKLMMIGGLVLAGAYFAYGRVDTIGKMYAVHVLFGIGIALAGLVPTARLIGRWFNAKRGTAMGIALAGSSFAGFVFAPLAVKFIAAHGMTGAFDRLAIAGLLLTFLVALFVVDEPERKGLSCFGEAPVVSGQSLSGMPFEQSYKTLVFWCLAFAACATFFSMLGTLFNLLPHMLDLGFDRATGVKGIQVMLTAALVGKFFFGWLSDYLKPKTVFLVNLVVMALGALGMAMADAQSVWWALGVFGLGWGGLYTMLQLLTVQSFGMLAAGRIMGLIAFFDAFGGGLGSYVMGIIRTQTNSYTLGFWLMFGLIVLATIAATQVRTVYSQAAR
jgi:MFS family permease